MLQLSKKKNLLKKPQLIIRYNSNISKKDLNKYNLLLVITQTISTRGLLANRNY